MPPISGGYTPRLRLVCVANQKWGAFFEGNGAQKWGTFCNWREEREQGSLGTVFGISHYIAKKIIRLGFFSDTQADYSLADGIGTGVLDQCEVGILGWDAGHFRKDRA